MATLKPNDEVHLVRDLVRAPDFAIARLLSDGKPRTPMEVYRGMGEFSSATAVAAFARLRKKGVARPVLVGERVAWKLEEGAAAVVRSLIEHQKSLEKITRRR